MFDTKKLIEAIQEDDPLSSYYEYAKWLVSHNEGESKGAIYLQQAIQYLAWSLAETKNIEIIRMTTGYVLHCERHACGHACD